MAKATKTNLDPNDLKQYLLEEYEHRIIRQQATKGDSALFSKPQRGQKGKWKPKSISKSNVECWNCHKIGHTKEDCWRPGGGAEGQGPHQNKGSKGSRQGPSANIANSILDSSDKEFAFTVTCTSTFEDVATALYSVPAIRRGAIIDSGASSHFCADRNKFNSFRPISQAINAADGRTFQALGVGNVAIELPNGSKITKVILRDVLYAPDVAFTLISMSRIVKAGFAVQFEGPWCEIMEVSPIRRVIARIPEVQGLYKLTGTSPINETANVAKVKISADELHRRMGHISPKAVEAMVKGGHVEGIELEKTSDTPFCVACTKAKLTRAPIPKTRSEERAVAGLGDRIHSDIWGPAQVQALTGESYFVTFTDEAKAWSEVEVLKKKDQTFQAYKNFEAWLETQFGTSVKEFHCDGGGEYINGLFDAHLKAKGTKRTITIHDTPQQNGISERLNRTILEHARAMLIGAGLPRFLWVEAVRHAIWLKNRSPTRALNGRTPFEAMGFGKPNLANLHEWGCSVWVQIEAGKLDAKAVKLRFVGYDAERKGFRVYWAEKRRVSVERNVRFEPDELTITEMTGDEGEQQKLTEVTWDEGEQQRLTIPVIPTAPSTVPDPPSADIAPSTPGEARHTEVEPQEPTIPNNTQPTPTRLPDGLDPIIPGTGRGLRTRRAPGDYARMNSGMSAHMATETEPEFALALGSNDDPRTVKEALAGTESEQWVQAMRVEIEQLERLKTWELVHAPPDTNIINSGFVLTRKRDASGQISSYKARFVGKGYSQVYGIDYYETFAPSVKMSSQRLVLSHAAREDWELHQIDVKGAYLNARLNEMIYIQPPHGYLKPGDEGKVCRLLKGLYGIKQAGRQWYMELCNTFAKLDLQRSHADHSVFYRHGDDPIIVTVSTDDMILAARSLRTIEKLKNDLRQQYEISDLGELHWLLGVEVKRDRTARIISLSQRAYIETVLKEFHLNDATTLSIPAEPGIVLGVHQCPKTVAEFKDMETVPYACGVGKLMYFYVATGPQIGYIIRILAQFMSNPGRAHWEALK